MVERQLFALYEANAMHSTGMNAVSEKDAYELNKKGFGIFWEVNSHKPKGKRGTRYIDELLSCYCEFDELSKEDQWKLLEAGLAPSLIVESQRGYHAYWNISGEISLRRYKDLQERIIHFFGADKAVKDPARVLRAPGFYHMKDPKEPFLVQVRYRSKAKYTSKEISHCFPKIPKSEEERCDIPIAFKKSLGNDLSEKIDSLGSRYALERLSGTPAVNGEWFGLKSVGEGKHNILVNGKMTACWIDKNDRIGSHGGGGPCFTNWVNWYHKDWRVTFRLLRQYLPELFE